MTKSNQSDNYSTDYDSFKTKIKALEDKVLKLQKENFILKSKASGLAKDNKRLEIENVKLEAKVEEKDATEKALLQHLNSLSNFSEKPKEFHEDIHTQSQRNERVKISETGSVSPNEYESFQRINVNQNECDPLLSDPVPAYIRCLEVDVDAQVMKPTLSFQDIQFDKHSLSPRGEDEHLGQKKPSPENVLKSFKKQTSLGAYQDNAVKKPQKSSTFLLLTL